MNTTTKKTNWINKVKTVQSVNKELVMRKLSIAESDYNDMWIDAGIIYLRQTLGIDADLAQELINSNLYWKWWLNHWQQWDAKFLTEAKHESPTLINRLYDQLHDPSASGFAPNKNLLKAMLAERVIDKLMDE